MRNCEIYQSQAIGIAIRVGYSATVAGWQLIGVDFR